jgi:tetratricopeptide (TPR) repeat protein
MSQRCSIASVVILIPTEPKRPWYKKEETLNQADAHTLSGDILSFNGNYEEAVAEYDKAIEIVPRNADLWVFKGITLSGGLGRHDEAMQCWERAKRLDPDIGSAIERTVDIEASPTKVDPNLLLCGRADTCRDKIRKLMEEPPP